ncbi:hypothetical protein ZIOFF_042988 [Zingiber officinale]|uniref:Ubiquitin-related modifier 1 n=1 Tax=Zingiber officinale TaxID=94328 RepID=A0A8J5FWK2_ZINOF|nr:hypothetical protein ZIOFF_042988 [Zingiber officinale]
MRCANCCASRYDSFSLPNAYFCWSLLFQHPKVPEKSAKDCFDRIHANFATPPQHQPRSRAKKADLSPIVHFAFGDKPLDGTKLKIRKARGTPDSLFTTGFLMKCSERSSSAHKRPLSRFKTNDVDPNPEVLKRIKNVALHERYIDHLHCIEARRRRTYHGKENHDRQVNALDYDDDSSSAGNSAAIDKSRRKMHLTLEFGRPGVLVLINDCDWELCGGIDTALEEKDVVVFISTLHGG